MGKLFAVYVEYLNDSALALRSDLQVKQECCELSKTGTRATKMDVGKFI